jgi:hypothetical protein
LWSELIKAQNYSTKLSSKKQKKYLSYKKRLLLCKNKINKLGMFETKEAKGGYFIVCQPAGQNGDNFFVNPIETKIAPEGTNTFCTLKKIRFSQTY